MATALIATISKSVWFTKLPPITFTIKYACTQRYSLIATRHILQSSLVVLNAGSTREMYERNLPTKMYASFPCG